MAINTPGLVLLAGHCPLATRQHLETASRRFSHEAGQSSEQVHGEPGAFRDDEGGAECVPAGTGGGTVRQHYVRIRALTPEVQGQMRGTQ